MRKAAKVFIWIGMICEFFLIFPIIVGIMSLKKIDNAISRAELQDFGIITLLFCSTLGGIFMLLMQDSDCKPVQKIEESSAAIDETKVEVKVEKNSNKEPLTDEQIAEKRKNTGKLLLKIFGIIFAVITFVLSIVFFFLTLSYVHASRYNYSNYGVDKEIKPYFESGFTVFLVLTILFLILTLVLVYFILKLFESKKKMKIIGMSMLAGVYVVISAIAIPTKVSRINTTLNEARQEQQQILEKSTLKYTEVSIEEFLTDVKRYPSKYNGKAIVLEGYVYGAKLNTFDLVFPYPSYVSSYYSSSYKDASYVSVEYIYNDTHPRVLYGDYIVVTGTVEVTESSSSLSVKITGATCVVK